MGIMLSKLAKLCGKAIPKNAGENVTNAASPAQPGASLSKSLPSKDQDVFQPTLDFSHSRANNSHLELPPQVRIYETPLPQLQRSSGRDMVTSRRINLQRHLSAFLDGQDIALTRHKTLDRGYLRMRGNLPDLLIGMRYAEGTQLVAQDLLLSMVEIRKKLDLGNTPGYFPFGRSSFLALSDIIKPFLGRFHDLLEGLQYAKTYWDEMFFELVTDSEASMQARARLRKQGMKDTATSIALWAMNELIERGEVLLPCHHQGAASRIAHFNVFYLKTTEKLGEVEALRFETMFPPSGFLPLNKLERIIHDDIVKNEGSGEVLVNPGTLPKNVFKAVGEEGSDVYILSCHGVRLQLSCLKKRDMDCMSRDSEIIRSLIAPVTERDCFSNRDVRDSIVQSMDVPGASFIPNQVLVKPQNPNECEFSAIDSAMRFLIGNEAAYNLIRIEQVIYSVALRSIFEYMPTPDADEIARDSQLRLALKSFEDRLRVSIKRHDSSIAAL